MVATSNSMQVGATAFPMGKWTLGAGGVSLGSSSVFPAKIYAIKQAARRLSQVRNKEVLLFVDSQAALRAIDIKETRANTTSECVALIMYSNVH